MPAKPTKTKAVKKVTNKVTKKVTKKVEEVEQAPKYNLKMEFNAEVFSCETNDLAKAFRSFAPIKLNSNVKVFVTEGDKSCERFLLLPKARMLFRNQIGVDAFIRSLIIK